MSRVQVILFLLVLVVVGCHEDHLTRNYPIVTTNAVSVITKAGADFSASFSNANPADILEHGFIWGTDLNLPLATSFASNLGVPSSSQFSTSIRSTLVDKTNYFVRGFVKTKTKTVYGPTRTFISAGSAGPTFTDFQPKLVAIGDTLTITGINFNDNLNFNSVIFLSGNLTIPTKPVKGNSKTLKVLVPFISTVTAQVGVMIEGKTVFSPTDLTLKNPHLISISNSSVRYCDELVINWESYGRLFNYIQINGVVQQVTSVTPTQIKVVAKNLSPQINVHLSVSAGVLNSFATFDDTRSFDINFDEIKATTTFPSIISADDLLPVTFSYLPACQNVMARVANTAILLQTISQSLNTFQFGFPQFSSIPSSFQIEFVAGDGRVFMTSPTITRSPTPWTEKMSFPGGARINPVTFVANNQLFVTSGVGSYANSRTVYVYTPAFDNWNSSGPNYTGPLNLTTPQAKPVSVGIDAIGYAGIWAGSVQFWKCFAPTGDWNQLGSFPGSAYESFLISFVIGSKIYVGGGYNYANQPDSRFWEYNPAANTWTRLADLPSFDDPYVMNFSLNGKGYFITLINSQIQFISYDPSTDSWASQASNFVPAFTRMQLAPMVFSDKVFGLDPNTGIQYGVDVQSLKLTYAGLPPIGNRQPGVTGVIGTKGYFGLLSNGNLQDFSESLFEFDPSKL